MILDRALAPGRAVRNTTVVPLSWRLMGVWVGRGDPAWFRHRVLARMPMAGIFTAIDLDPDGGHVLAKAYGIVCGVGGIAGLVGVPWGIVAGGLAVTGLMMALAVGLIAGRQLLDRWHRLRRRYRWVAGAVGDGLTTHELLAYRAGLRRRWPVRATLGVGSAEGGGFGRSS